jgi:hypothetical protein
MAQLRVEGGEGSREITLPQGGEMVFLVAEGEPKSLQLAMQRPDRYLAAVLRAGRHWVVFVPAGGGDVAIDGVPVPSLKILDDQSVLTVGGFALRLAERVEEVLTPDANVVRQKKACPWCQEPFAAKDLVIYCPTCGLAHHGTCLQRGKHCGSFPFCGYWVPQEERQEKAAAGR